MKRARVSLLGQAICLATSVGFGLALSVRASAQLPQSTPWLPDRQYREGPGIKVGELELHPGIAIRGGYDSNVFRADGETNGGVTFPIQDAAILAVSPHLYLSTETAQRAREGEDREGTVRQVPFLAFRTGLAAHYLHYFLEDAPHNVGAEADMFLGIAQNRQVGADVSFEYTRSVPPFTQNAGSRNAYVFDAFQPRLRLNFRSRSQVLTSYVGYAPRFTFYEDKRVFGYLNSFVHLAEVGAAWRFLPSTALVYDGNYAYQDFTEPDRDELIIVSNSNIFRTRFGINGALTNTLGLRVLGGYAVGFFRHGGLDDFEDGIGEAVLTYRFDPHVLDFGYQRNIQSSYAGAWYQTDRGFAKVSFLFAQRFALGLEAGVGHANYGRLVRTNGMGDVVGAGVGGDTSREDIRIDGAVRGEYRVTNWLAFMADFVAQSALTDFEYAQLSSMGAQIADPAGYTFFQVFGGVRAHY